MGPNQGCHHKRSLRAKTAGRMTLALLASLALPYVVREHAAQPAGQAAQSYPVVAIDAGPQTRVDLEWPDLDPRPSPQRVTRREWKLVAAVSLVALATAGWVARQEHRRAEAEQALAARMSLTELPAPATEASEASEAGDEPEAPARTAARASAASHAGELSIGADATTFVLPARRRAAADGEAEAQAAADADAAASAAGGQQAAAAGTPTPAASVLDPGALIDRAPSAAGTPPPPASAAASARQRPISFHQLDGRPLSLKSAGQLPELGLGLDSAAPPALFR